jgi:phosphoribosyl-ATP pyrophosphohydrolase
MDVLLDVAEIHAAQGLTITAHPTTNIAAHMKDLCCALIEEEAAEFRAAVDANDLVEIADALADLLWVVIVGALTFGIPLGEVFAEVLRSNRSKADASGRVEVGPNGKIRKDLASNRPTCHRFWTVTLTTARRFLDVADQPGPGVRGPAVTQMGGRCGVVASRMSTTR